MVESAGNNDPRESISSFCSFKARETDHVAFLVTSVFTERSTGRAAVLPLAVGVVEEGAVAVSRCP